MEERAASPPAAPIGKTLLTILLFAAGAAVPYAVPSLARYRLVGEGAFRALLSGTPRVRLVVPVAREAAEPPAAREKATAPAPGLPRTEGSEAPPRPRRPRTDQAQAQADLPPAGEPLPIEDEDGALVPFFERLLATERREPGAITRISHFGDSPVTGDLITGEARARLQKLFGDAGHGFILASRPWGWYGHNGVTLRASGWKALSPLLAGGDGGHHGLGVVSFVGSAEAKTEIEVDAGGFSRLEVSYLERPGGGRFTVAAGDGPEAEVDTNGAERKDAFFARTLPVETRKVTLRPRGSGTVSVYGVVLEKEGPGIVYDSLGANGAAVHALTLLDADGFVRVLSARRSDLVILGYGTNESGYAGIPGTRYRQDWVEVISRVKKALPGASILLMAPMDRGVRLEDGSIGTLPSIPKIVEAQRRIAAENGCAFFDTYAAMGGEGTMARWYEREPRLVSGDYTHTTKGGSDRVARLLVDALVEAFEEWRSTSGR